MATADSDCSPCTAAEPSEPATECLQLNTAPLCGTESLDTVDANSQDSLDVHGPLPLIFTKEQLGSWLRRLVEENTYKTDLLLNNLPDINAKSCDTGKPVSYPFLQARKVSIVQRVPEFLCCQMIWVPEPAFPCDMAPPLLSFYILYV
jgi:hypothetical protein